MAIRPLSKELQELAERELNETPDRVENDIKHIRDWLDKQPHINARKDDEMILHFLRWSKFSVQRAKERIDIFYTMKTLVPEFFSKRDPFLPEIQDTLRRGIILPLIDPDQSANVPVKLMIRWKAGDPHTNTFINIVKVSLMIIDIVLIEDDRLSVIGGVAVEDFIDYPFNYLLQQTPAVCKKSLLAIQNAYPIRLKGVYFFNVPSFIDKLFNLFKPFLSDKIKSRIKFFESKDIKKMYEDIPLAALPLEYGGKAASIEDLTATWKKKVESYADWFAEDEKYHSDETKRAGKAKTSADIFGVEGSFRKLDID